LSEIVNNFLLNNYQYLPFIVFFMLLLAAINIPFSEDLIIITCAIVAHEHKQSLIPLYVAIYTGVIIGDHIAYWIGFHLGHNIKKIKWFAKVLSDKKVSVIQKYLNKYGIFTFIVCRFIPFGVRNTLFMTSGFSKMNYKYFSIYDIIAATINTSTLYFLIYFIGISVEKPFKIIGIVLFFVLLAALLTLFLNFFVFKKEKAEDSNISMK